MVAFSLLSAALPNVARTRNQWRWAPLPSPAAATVSAALSRRRRRFAPYARLQSSLADAKVPTEQSEIIFLGTGTSEGIPRVSCLTHPTQTCVVCSKATEPGNKNRRRNTGILIRYINSLGRYNILVDADFSTIVLFSGFLLLG